MEVYIWQQLVDRKHAFDYSLKYMHITVPEVRIIEGLNK